MTGVVVPRDPVVVVLGGGTGASRLAAGLERLGLLERSLVVVNVADDLEVHGLAVWPDLDTVVYRLAARLDRARGWGLEGDTTVVLDELRRLGAAAWFTIGDRDLATHVARTALLREGRTPTEVAHALCTAHGLPPRVVPVSEDPVRTRVALAGGEEVAFQTYHVRLRARPAATAVRYDGLATARPAPGVLDALRRARLVVLAASSPVASVLPMLGTPGVRGALGGRSGGTAAVTPVVLGVPPGPAMRHRALTRQQLLGALGTAHAPHAVAALYAGLIDAFVVDAVDAATEVDLLPDDVQPVVAATTGDDPDDAARLLEALLARSG